MILNVFLIVDESVKSVKYFHYIVCSVFTKYSNINMEDDYSFCDISTPSGIKSRYSSNTYFL